MQKILSTQTKYIGIYKRAGTHVDRPETRTMPRRHILVQAPHGVRARQLAVLLVHVVRARARIVPDPDTEVLHLQGLLFVDLGGEGSMATPKRLPFEGCKGSTHNIDTNDFTVGLFDLLQLAVGIVRRPQIYRFDRGA